MKWYIVHVFDQAARESYEMHCTSSFAFESALEHADFVRQHGCKATIIDGDAPVRMWRVWGSKNTKHKPTVMARSAEEALLQVRFDWRDDTFSTVQMVEEGTCAKKRPGVLVYQPNGQMIAFPCEDYGEAHEYLELYTSRGWDTFIVDIVM